MGLQDLEAFFEPEKLAELELVQAVTLKFTEDTGK